VVEKGGDGAETEVALLEEIRELDELFDPGEDLFRVEVGPLIGGGWKEGLRFEEDGLGDGYELLEGRRDREWFKLEWRLAVGV
jgi:hypothetical protein